MTLLFLFACTPPSGDSGKDSAPTATDCTDATWYGDVDGDSFGDDAATTTVSSCDAPPVGYVTVGGDCDDRDDTIFPGATELCDGFDQNCDGTADEGVSTSIWYTDLDGDGYGDDTTAVEACAQPTGTSATGGDCDDDRAAAHPGATESCDGTDEDCDGTADEDAPDAPTWYTDADSDGYGADVAGVACAQPAGTAAVDGDCDDADPAVNPAAAELCNGLDDDCDGDRDEDATDAIPLNTDADSDGYGDPLAPVTACAGTAGLVADDTDCNDAAPDTHPGAPETCDGTDEDCNGAIDDITSGGMTVYADTDGDSYGDPTAASLACEVTAGFASDASDCDDSTSTTHPDAEERCDNGVDDDCDGVVDDGCVVEHCGSISVDETWDASFVHQVTCDVEVGGSSAPTLTIADGATVLMNPGTSIKVGWSSSGRLIADGAVAGITVTSALGSPLPGDWGYLGFGSYDRQSALTGVTVEYGGYGSTAGIYVWWNNNDHPITLDGVTVRDSAGDGAFFYEHSHPEITDSTFEDNAAYGVHIVGSLDAPFEDNVLTGNGTAMYLNGADVTDLSPTSTFTGNDNDWIEVAGDTIETDATWVDVGVPYHVMGSQFVEGSIGPTLTIEAGAELQFAAGVGIEVARHANGSMAVEGTEADPVILTAINPGAGNWEGLLVWEALGFSVTHADVSYGGNGGAGCIGDVITTGPDMVVTHSTIHDCSNYGLYVTGTGTLTLEDSVVSGNDGPGVATAWYGQITSLTGTSIIDNDGNPLLVGASSLPAFGPDNDLSGNAEDEILFSGGTLTADATLYDYGVPWHVTADTAVASSARPTLTIADGAELYFDANTGLQIGDYYGDGLLMVEGGTRGVLMTSSTSSPIAGDWDGLWFTYGSGGSVVAGLTVEYGGGNGYGGVVLWSSGDEGREVTLTDLEVHDNLHAGVYCHYCYANIADAVIRGNGGAGLYADGYDGGLWGLARTSIEDNDGTALSVDATSLLTLDLSTLSISGNGLDGVEFPGSGYSGSHTLTDLGLPYVITSDLTVDAGETLTIEPGVELRFADSVALRLVNGTLSAVGTAVEPILFTSAQDAPLPGDWDGLYFWSSASSIVDHAEIRYAGDNGYAAVYCSQVDISLSNTRITGSAHWGMYRDYGCVHSYPSVTYVDNLDGDLY